MTDDTRYSEEELKTVREDLIGWAIRTTRLEGKFTKNAALEQGFGPGITAQLVDRLSSEGKVSALSGRKGYVWCDLPPDPLGENASRTPYTPDQWAEVHHLFSVWARETTEREGKFSRSGSRTASGLGYYLADQACEWAIAEGRVEICDEGGSLRWRGVELPKSLNARRKHSRYTAHEWGVLRSSFEEWGRSRAHFSANQVVKQFQIGHETADRLIQEFVEAGDLVKLDNRRGYAWLGAVRPGRSLEDLLEEAKKRKDSTFRLAPGRKPKGFVPDVRRLTPKQVEDIQRLCNAVADWLGAPTLRDLPLSDPRFADDGEGGWALTTLVQERTEVLPKSTRAPLRGADDLLRALARDCGLIDADSGTLHERYVSTHAAEWQLVIDDWLPRLVAAEGKKARYPLQLGLRVLARFCTRRGELDPTKVRWSAVTAAIDAAREDDALTKSSHNSARRAYRVARKVGLHTGPQWGATNGRIALVGSAAVEAAVESFDFGGWTDSAGRALRLVDGTRGLATYCTWATQDSWRLMAEGLPPRECINPNPKQMEMIDQMLRAGREPYRLEPVTLRARLHHLSYLLGDMEDAGVNVASLELLDLCDPARLEWLGKRMIKRRKQEGGPASLPAFIPSLANQLAVIASPFLEAVARKDKDEETATRARRAAELLRAFRKENNRRVIRRKDIKKIAEAWLGSDGVEGWLKLLRLRELLVAEIERLGGGSLLDQCERLRQGKLCASPAWALAVRAAVLVNFGRLIPVRRRALSGLREEMWDNSAVSEDQMGRELHPWEGQIIINFPDRLMKRKVVFSPAYIARAAVGSPRHEFGAARELLELWFRKGGAREEILRLPDGRVLRSSYVFPAFVRQAVGENMEALAEVEKRQGRWTGDGISDQFHELVVRYARELRIDLPKLLSLGGTRVHVVTRLLFGTYWGPRNLVECSRLLHHKNTTITEKLYCGYSVEGATREATEDEQAGVLRVGGGAAVTRSDQEADEVQRRLDELQQRAVEAERRADEAEARLAQRTPDRESAA